MPVDVHAEIEIDRPRDEVAAYASSRSFSDAAHSRTAEDLARLKQIPGRGAA
jgi:hypothetical protein